MSHSPRSTPVRPVSPLAAPMYGASLGAAFRRFWKKYAVFTGRASRSEFWWWQLILLIGLFAIALISVVVTLIPAVQSDGRAGTINPTYFVVSAILWAIILAVLVPTFSLIWRRLHDTNRSGGYYFLGLVPIVGPFILLAFLVSPSDPAGIRFDQPATDSTRVGGSTPRQRRSH
jgi:uncharacterized membrane protein YhaH (DUF805 family)